LRSFAHENGGLVFDGQLNLLPVGPYETFKGWYFVGSAELVGEGFGSVVAWGFEWLFFIVFRFDLQVHHYRKIMEQSHLLTIIRPYSAT
jgi:hypothetical protein